MTDQPTAPVTESPTALAAELIQTGATPVQVDVDAMLAQIQALQGTVNQLLAERGIPTDPVAAKIQDIADHVAARSAQYPYVDLSEIKAILDSFPADSAEVTSTHSDLLKTSLDEHLSSLRGLELHYLGHLAKELHISVLKTNGG